MPYRLLLFLLFFSQSLAAQQFNFTNIGTDKGLPSSEVYYVLQDSRGYIWCATNNGVSRYNGKEFITYTMAQGLTDNTVFRMCEDHKGRIWFGPQNNELCYWYHDSIFQVSAGKKFADILPTTGSVISDMYADSSDNIWVNTSPDGIFVLKSKNLYTEIESIKPDCNCHVALKAIEGKKVMSAWQWFEERNKTIAPKDLVIGYSKQNRLNFAQFKNVLPFANGVKGSATYLSDGRLLYVYDKHLYLIFPDGKTEIKQFENSITCIKEDGNKGLWIGFVNAGVLHYSNGDINSFPEHILDHYSISNIWQDHEGSIWLSSLEHGIFFIPSLSISVYPDIPALEDRIISLAVFNDKVIASTYGTKIVEADEFRKIVPSNNLEKAKGSSTSNRLYSLRIIDDKVYACFGEGFLIMDKFLNNPQKLFYKGTISSPKDVVRSDDHKVWEIWGAGIRQVRGDTTYNVPFRLTCAIAEKGSALYLGGKKGLYLFDKEKFTSLASINPLLKNQIIEMKKDSKGNLWIATIGAGVLILKDDKVIQLTKKNGLISDICSAIEKDEYENIWVGTPQGLSCIMKTGDAVSNWKIKNITKNNGLNSNEITKLCAYQNNLWVGTMSGISAVNISQITKLINPSAVYIQSIKINNTTTDTNQRSLTYDQNNFKFILEGLTYTNNPGCHYRYRLIGHDSCWQETTTDEIGFNNLSPGNYTFQAAVANTDGIWSKLPVSYNFMIDKPFWLRWWFILIEIGLLGFAIYLFIRFRERIITKREEEKSRISKLLAEYQMKALQAQMNPHFIFNAMNSIQSFILQNDSGQAYDYLTKFSKLVRFVLISTKENEMTLKQEIEILILYIELEQLRFENAFDFNLHIDQKIDTELVMIPTLLIQPYVENAIWHGLMPLKERKGILDISISVENEMLKIKITDNGLGRERSQLIRKKLSHKSMGMDINKKRVELFGEGNKEAHIVITDLYNGAEPNGTSVEITLPLIETY